ncbi:MAG: arginine deiminase, partial [Gammaproteobacteria bacterium]|nr:arginine deiminase [Gammaproteobacteria bacterium]
MVRMTKMLGANSEVGVLKTVMVCKPGLAHERLTPSNCADLLYDDVIWVQQARRDHFDFVSKMSDRGVNVLEMHDLLEAVLEMPEGRKYILDRRITPGYVGLTASRVIRPWLDEMPAQQLAMHLIGGLAPSEMPFADERIFTSFTDDDGFVLQPLPNTTFTRDTTCWIYGGVTLNPMFWPARRQETLLTAAIYRFHPFFTGREFEVWWGDADVDQKL